MLTRKSKKKKQFQVNWLLNRYMTLYIKNNKTLIQIILLHIQ